MTSTPTTSRVSLKTRKTVRNVLAVFAVLVVGSAIYNGEKEAKANLLVFRGAPTLQARVDGVDSGALSFTEHEIPTALVVELTSGSHQIDVIDAAGKVVEHTTLSSVPAQAYRALYAVGEPGRYAVVQVGYGESVQGDPVLPLTPAEPHVYILPSSVYLPKKELALVDVPFPDEISTKSSMTLHHVCSLDGAGKPSCLTSGAPRH